MTEVICRLEAVSELVHDESAKVVRPHVHATHPSEPVPKLPFLLRSVCEEGSERLHLGDACTTNAKVLGTMRNELAWALTAPSSGQRVRVEPHARRKIAPGDRR